MTCHPFILLVRCQRVHRRQCLRRALTWGTRPSKHAFELLHDCASAPPALLSSSAVLSFQLPDKNSGTFTASVSPQALNDERQENGVRIRDGLLPWRDGEVCFSRRLLRTRNCGWQEGSFGLLSGNNAPSPSPFSLPVFLCRSSSFSRRPVPTICYHLSVPVRVDLSVPSANERSRVPPTSLLPCTAKGILA